jgi:hypothetical protein
MAYYVQLPNQNRISGINPLAYMGTEANTPPQLVLEKRPPTVNDCKGWTLGTMWIVKGQEDVWVLVDKGIVGGVPNQATWANVHPPAQLTLTADDTNTAYPINNNINVFGGVNIHTTSTDPNQNVLTVSMVDHPTLVGGLTVSAFAAPGVVTTDGTGLFHSTNGTNQQIIIARAAGPVWANLTSTGGSVVITDNGNNINLEALGGGGGGVAGLVGDDGLTVSPNAGLITISSGGDIIVSSRTSAHVLNVDIAQSATAGQIVMGGGAGNDSAWGTLESTNGSIGITYIPGAPPKINLTAIGVGGFGGLKDSSAVIAVPDANSCVTVTGIAPITTTTVGSVVTASLNAPASDGKVLISSSAGTPAWANIIGAGGITVTNGHNSIAITGGGGGGGGGFVLFNLDNNHVNTNASNVLTITGGATVANAHTGANQYVNCYMTGDGANLMKIALTSSIFLPITNAGQTSGVIGIGTNPFIHAYGTNNTFVGSTAGSFSLTTASAHDNTGLGFNCLSGLTTGAANVSAGSQSLNSCTTGSRNSSYGVNALQTITTTSDNTGLGYHAGYALTGGNNTIIGSGAMDVATSSVNCIAIGYNAGNALTTGSSDILIGNAGTATLSNSIKIGTQGSGAGQQNTCYIAGIVGNGVSNPMPVFINSATGQLGVGAAEPLSPVYGPLYINGAGTGYAAAATGTAGQVLTSNGAGAAPTYQTIGGAGSDAFMYIQQTNVPNAFPTPGTIYFLGSTVALTKLYDRGGTQFVGVNFTASKAGIWFFNMSVSLNNMTSADWTSCSLEAVEIIVHDGTTPANSLTYAIANIPNPGYGGWETNADQLTLQFSVMAPMSVGATAQFCVSVNPDFTSPANIGLGPVIAQNPATANATFVSGYFVSA